MGPVSPAAPVSPVAPLAPVSPVAPVAPVAPGHGSLSREEDFLVHDAASLCTWLLSLSLSLSFSLFPSSSTSFSSSLRRKSSDLIRLDGRMDGDD